MGSTTSKFPGAPIVINGGLRYGELPSLVSKPSDASDASKPPPAPASKEEFFTAFGKFASSDYESFSDYVVSVHRSDEARAVSLLLGYQVHFDDEGRDKCPLHRLIKATVDWRFFEENWIDTLEDLGNLILKINDEYKVDVGHRHVTALIERGRFHMDIVLNGIYTSDYIDNMDDYPETFRREVHRRSLTHARECLGSVYTIACPIEEYGCDRDTYGMIVIAIVILGHFKDAEDEARRFMEKMTNFENSMYFAVMVDVLKGIDVKMTIIKPGITPTPLLRFIPIRKMALEYWDNVDQSTVEDQ